MIVGSFSSEVEIPVCCGLMSGCNCAVLKGLVGYCGRITVLPGCINGVNEV